MNMSVDQTKVSTGRRIQEARKAAGYETIQSFARALEANPSQIVRWESGSTTPRAEALREIARLCGTSTDYLLGLEAA